LLEPVNEPSRHVPFNGWRGEFHGSNNKYRQLLQPRSAEDRKTSMSTVRLPQSVIFFETDRWPPCLEPMSWTPSERAFTHCHVLLPSSSLMCHRVRASDRSPSSKIRYSKGSDSCLAERPANGISADEKFGSVIAINSFGEMQTENNHHQIDGAKSERLKQTTKQ